MKETKSKMDNILWFLGLCDLESLPLIRVGLREMLNLRKNCGGYLDELNDEDERVLEILLHNNNMIKR